MQVLVDRASRATTDEEMDALDNDLLKALGELRHLRDRLSGSALGSAPLRADCCAQRPHGRCRSYCGPFFSVPPRQ